MEWWCIAGEGGVSDREIGELKHGTNLGTKLPKKDRKKRSNNSVQLLYFHP